MKHNDQIMLEMCETIVTGGIPVQILHYRHAVSKISHRALVPHTCQTRLFDDFELFCYLKHQEETWFSKQILPFAKMLISI